MKMEKKKVLFVATVVKAHIMAFHIPYLKWYKENGYEISVCAKNDYDNKEIASYLIVTTFMTFLLKGPQLNLITLEHINNLKILLTQRNLILFIVIHLWVEHLLV